jgi:predicted RNA methylase
MKIRIKNIYVKYANDYNYNPEIQVKEITLDKQKKLQLFGSDKKDLKITNIGMYSITDPQTAQRISDTIKKILKTNKLTITDATANNGGNTINFAKNFKFVNSVEIVSDHCKVLENNIKAFNLENVKIYCDDFISIKDSLTNDVIFIDPPWGGPDYIKHEHLELEVGSYKLANLVNELLKSNAKLIVIKVPRNYDFDNLRKNIKANMLEIQSIINKYTNKLSYYVAYIKK